MEGAAGRHALSRRAGMRMAWSRASSRTGGQLVSLGFLAELIVAHTGKDADTYSVCERINLPPS